MKLSLVLSSHLFIDIGIKIKKALEATQIIYIKILIIFILLVMIGINILLKIPKPHMVHCMFQK